MFKYRNVSDQELLVMEVGVVEPNGEIESDRIIENPKLQLLSDVREVQPVAPETPALPTTPVIQLTQPNDEGNFLNG
jgi:hypothetical protein